MQLYIATAASNASDASGGQTQVPLAKFAKITPGTAPLIVNHFSNRRTNTQKTASTPFQSGDSSCCCKDMNGR